MRHSAVIHTVPNLGDIAAGAPQICQHGLLNGQHAAPSNARADGRTSDDVTRAGKPSTLT